MIGKTIAELTAGDRAEITRVVEPGDIASFVEAVGDYNPVHSDPAYAAGTPFKEPIAPGIYTAGLVSAAKRNSNRETPSSTTCRTAPGRMRRTVRS